MQYGFLSHSSRGSVLAVAGGRFPVPLAFCTKQLSEDWLGMCLNGLGPIPAKGSGVLGVVTILVIYLEKRF